MREHAVRGPKGESFQVLTLIRRGGQKASRAAIERGLDPQQRTWSGLVKRSELNHDTEVYRTCNWKRRRLLEEGVTLRCIRIDAELKSAVAQRSERARPRHVRSEHSAMAGARVMTAPGVPPRGTRPPSNCERRCNPGKSASA